jgi:hypothetical protein
MHPMEGWDHKLGNFICLKNFVSNTVNDYTKTHSLKNEPAFAWWLPIYEKKRKSIINTASLANENKTRNME